jgi:hypothetical protein
VTEGQRRDVRTIFAWVAGIAVVAGIGVVLAGPSPTGSTIIDTLLLIAVVAACIFCIATAPWLRRWNETLRLGHHRRRVGHRVRAGTARQHQVLRRHVGDRDVPVLALTLISIQRRSGQRRLQLWSVFGGIVAAGILTLIGFGVAAASARPNLTRGTDEARRALDSLKSGDFTTAQQGFDLAAALLDGARDDLEAPWSQPARLIPVVAQHRRAATDLAETAASVSTTISDVLDEVDFDDLRRQRNDRHCRDHGVAGSAERLNIAMDDLDSTVTSVDNDWLVQPIRPPSTLSEQIDKQQLEGDRPQVASGTRHVGRQW